LKEVIVTTKRVASSLVLSIVLLGGPSLARSQSGGMSGMDMGHEIVIPKGALYTKADVEFMQGMIAHHAQAVVMAGMTPTHGAGADIRIFAERINVGQRDEIAFMQRWLRDRHETAPDPFAGHDMSTAQPPAAGVSMPGAAMPGMAMPGMSMPDRSMPDRSMPRGLMPGMLTPEQMKQLDAARGAEFDRLFLTFMIQHHQGALTMVDQLFSSPGAAQDGYVFRFASDVSADQNTEIERMRSMLTARATHGN
jgi:uncharacterized protein (DUF305 family)